MHKFFTIFAALAISALALPVAGCADKQLNNYVCTHQTVLEIAANATITSNTGEHPVIKDATARQAAIDGANVTLGLIAKCDPATPQAPPGAPSAPIAPPG